LKTSPFFVTDRPRKAKNTYRRTTKKGSSNKENQLFAREISNKKGDNHVKKSISKFGFLATVLVAGAIALTSPAMAGHKQDRMYRVTITNVMLGQPVAPSVIATHTDAFQLFELGPAPMPGDPGYDDYLALAAMAETGYPFHVLDQVSASNGVYEAVALPTSRTPPVLLPSESNSIEISASGNAKYLTAVAMLGATNDAVYAVRGVELPKGINDSIDAFATAYDVGSEANAESPATVGFLGSMEDNGATFDGINDGSGEGFIYVHAGIHGVGGAGGLDPATYDWRNPVVKVTIERIK